MNRTGKDVDTIFIHCTAGYSDLAAQRRFWRSLGWRTDGYHEQIGLNGEVYGIVPFNLPSNGVKGYNAKSINISYIGGVLRSNTAKASDTRTVEQKCGIEHAILLALQWIHENGGDVRKVKIKGHRDASPDQNGDGVIASWERIKECPCFDAIPEYAHMVDKFLANLGITTPKIEIPKVPMDVEYVVRGGDTISKIAHLNKTTVASIMQKNKIKNVNLIKVGQRLVI